MKTCSAGIDCYILISFETTHSIKFCLNNLCQQLKMFKLILFVICVNYVIATTEMRINYPEKLVELQKRILHKTNPQFFRNLVEYSTKFLICALGLQFIRVY